ncbi:hypothetical protein [Emcibacter sp.]
MSYKTFSQKHQSSDKKPAAPTLVTSAPVAGPEVKPAEIPVKPEKPGK